MEKGKQFKLQDVTTAKKSDSEIIMQLHDLKRLFSQVIVSVKWTAV